ncbi:MAG: hypothetical protein AB8G96_10000, partial [Phycisphaerales bacterium]
AALRRTDGLDLETILSARAAGEVTAVPGRPGGARRTSRRLVLTDRSDAWAFRIDVRVGPVERSWWTIMQRSPADGSWTVEQRLAITD